jgi:Rrf2 family protein
VFSLTRKTDYALVALTSMAAEGDLVSARDLARRLNLPLPVLRNVLKRLAQVGLISSARGQQGGYQLAREAEAISLVDLIEAMEGPLRLTMCCRPEGDPERCACEREDACAVKRPVQRVHGLMKQFLSRISIAQIAADDMPQDLFTMVAAGNRLNGSAHRIPITNH